MSNIDTLKIYDDLKASGVPENQAHAQAMAIYHANRVTPEDLKLFEAKTQALYDKIVSDLMWMRLIGAAMTFAFVSNWFK